MLFKLPAGLDRVSKKLLVSLLDSLPPLDGAGIQVVFRPALSSHRGGIVSGSAKGTAVHAGTNLRGRRIILDKSLLADHTELARIFIHEVFHFVWPRLSNATRRRYEMFPYQELGCDEPGELGWSSLWRKESLTAEDRRNRSRRWREYICESFCDSAAWNLSQISGHEEFTLHRRFMKARALWFSDFLSGSERLRI